MKKFLLGFLVGCLLMVSTPVLADSILKKIDVVMNSVNVQVNSKDLDSNSILYNGTTYLPLRKVAEAVGKEVEWSQNTMTANIVDKKAVSSEIPNIIDYGFQNNGTSTFYGVKFSDGFSVGLNVPKNVAPELNYSYEYVTLAINTKYFEGDVALSTPNIIGFNELYGDKYYPIRFDDYVSGLPETIYDDFRSIDFFENFKLYKQGDESIYGIIYYESFPFLDGVTYDDGVHKCTLYLEDKAR